MSVQRVVIGRGSQRCEFRYPSTLQRDADWAQPAAPGSHENSTIQPTLLSAQRCPAAISASTISRYGQHRLASWIAVPQSGRGRAPQHERRRSRTSRCSISWVTRVRSSWAEMSWLRPQVPVTHLQAACALGVCQLEVSVAGVCPSASRRVISRRLSGRL